MTAQRPICPCCGTDIVVDAPIMINDFAMNGAGHPLFYRAKQVRLSHGEALICWALMKAYPHHLSIDVLGERLDTDAEDIANNIRALISKIRRKLAELGAPNVIYTLKYHHAYVWNPRGEGHEVPAQDEDVPAESDVLRRRTG